MKPKNIIFDLSRKDWKYKGILFAEADNNDIDNDSGMPPMPKDYIVGVMVLIYTDENGDWNHTLRLKFPSGNKTVFRSNYGKDANETIILQKIYSFPITKKTWIKNPDEMGESILKIIKDLDMI